MTGGGGQGGSNLVVCDGFGSGECVGGSGVPGLGQRGCGHGGDVAHVDGADPCFTDRGENSVLLPNRGGHGQQPLEEQVWAQKRVAQPELVDSPFDSGVVPKEPHWGGLIGGQL